MPKRPIPVLLALAAVAAIGIAWLARVASEAPRANEASTGLRLPTEDSRAETDHDESVEIDPGSGDELATSEAVPVPRQVPVDPPEVRAAAAASRAEAELAGAIWVEGRVLVPPDTPADDIIEVVADGAKFPTRELHRVAIGRDGSFRVGFAPTTGVGTLRIDARWVYLPRVHTLWLTRERAPIVLRAHLGGRVRGHVLLAPSAVARAESLVGSGIRARSPVPEEQFGVDGSRTCTGRLSERLEFELGPLPPGDCELTALAPGVVPSSGPTVPIRQGEFSDVTMDLELGASLSGVVTDPSGNPVENASVLLARLEDPPPGPGSNRPVERDAVGKDGSFRFDELGSGSWTLVATSHDWLESDPATATLAPGQIVEGIRLVLRPGASVVGVVRHADGSPARGVQVTLRGSLETSRASQEVPFRIPTLREPQETDQGGRFAFRGLQTGTYGILAGNTSASSFRDLDKLPLAAIDDVRILEGDAPTEVELTLAAPGAVEGRVVDVEGAGVAGASIRLMRGDSWIEGQFRCDDSGRFAVRHLASGRVSLRAEADALWSHPVEVEIRAGGISNAEVVVRSGTLLLVMVKDDQDQPVSARVVVEPTHDRAGSWTERPTEPDTESQADVHRFGPLPPGDYTVRAILGPDRTVERRVSLSESRKELCIVRVSADR